MFVVFLSSKYYEPLMADVPRWSKDHNQSALNGFSILHCDSASSTFLHGLTGRNLWNSFDMLNHAPTTQKIICSFELSLFSCLLTLVYQLIVRSNCASVFINAYYSCGPSSHSIPEWLGETNSSISSNSRIGSKQLCSADQILIQLLVCSTLKNYPLYVRNVMRIALSLMNSWRSDTSRHHFHFSLPCCRNQNADKWIVMCEFNTPSNLVAW